MYSTVVGLLIVCILINYGGSTVIHNPTAASSNEVISGNYNSPVFSTEDSVKPDVLLQYNWLTNYQTSQALETQIGVPDGYRRIPFENVSFAFWLRNLALLNKGAPVKLYNQQIKAYQAGAYRVLDIDIGTKNLQQCADAIMRLRAEYLFETQNFEALHFNYTSGDRVAFNDWAEGRKPILNNGKVYFSKTTENSNYSYSNFRKYLKNIFIYAGTASLSKELVKKEIKDINPGDVFIKGGFPGHAVLVVDVAEHQQTGKKIFLLAQSYMPAQSIHILRNFNNIDLSPWYPEDFGPQLQTPEWTFDRHSLKGFEDK